MIDGLKPYPKMKDSGVPAIGEMPAHWEVRPIGRMGRITKGRGGSKEDAAEEGVPCVRYGDLYTKHRFFIKSTDSFVGADRARDYTSLQRGDVLFAGSGESLEEIGKSAVSLLDDAVCGGDVLIFRPNGGFVPKFIGYAADSPVANAQKATMGRGFTVVHVYGDELKALQLPVPPLEEQELIARFLDHANERIERYIRSKEKLIDLLEEQKQAIIHRAVTRGLDPNAPLKPSGIPWLGGIPEHWETSRLGGLFFERNETGFSDLPLLEVSLKTGVRPRTMSASDRKQRVGDLSAYKRALEGDIAYNMMRMYQGAVGVVPRDGLVSSAYVVARPHRHAAGRYYGALFRTRAFVEEADRYSRGITEHRNRLYWDDFKQIRVPVPPQSEQSEIAVAADIHDQTINAAVRDDRRTTDLLREYRARLISDVVTGKLDVREAAVADTAEAIA